MGVQHVSDGTENLQGLTWSTTQDLPDHKAGLRQFIMIQDRWLCRGCQVRQEVKTNRPIYYVEDQASDFTAVVEIIGLHLL